TTASAQCADRKIRREPGDDRENCGGTGEDVRGSAKGVAGRTGAVERLASRIAERGATGGNHRSGGQRPDHDRFRPRSPPATVEAPLLPAPASGTAREPG